MLVPRTISEPSKMPYSIRVSVADDGEVHPLVIGSDALPAWWPNLWLLTVHRNRGAAFGTLQLYAKCLCRIYSWAEARHCELDQRMLERNWLVDWELHSLADVLSVQVRGGLSEPKRFRKRPGGNVEQFLGSKTAEAPLVLQTTIGARMNLVADYLRWLGQEGVNRAPFAAKTIHTANLNDMVQGLVAKTPINHEHNKRRHKGYDQDGVRRLLEVVTPGHPENPWRRAEVQRRNHMIVHMLFTFGLRVGELCALYVRDINFQAQVLAVARRPDDPNDPRGRNAPHQKTRARVMALELIDLIKAYKQIRKAHDTALKHPYLLVSAWDGMPLSIAAIEKAFRELRENVPGLPVKLTPHLLRHAWNYEWSILCKEKGISDDLADQMRKTLMGWKMSSTMPQRYNAAYIQERADECSLEVQRRLWSLAEGAQAVVRRMKEEASQTKGAAHV